MLHLEQGQDDEAADLKMGLTLKAQRDVNSAQKLSLSWTHPCWWLLHLESYICDRS
jgi:hypothetical protein